MGDSTPTFVDIDKDGDFDAFIGEPDGTIKYYENTDPSITVTKENDYGGGGTTPGTENVPLIENIDVEGNKERSDTISVTFTPQPKEALPTQTTIALPTRFELHQNFPNPFNPETWIPFQLPRDADVTVEIYNLNGQIVRTLSLGKVPAGYYNEKSDVAFWDGSTDTGEKVSSGVYFYRLKAGDYSAVKRMVIVK